MFNNVSKIRAISRIILLMLIAATVVFIFANSLKSKEQSAEDSSAVSGFIATIFPPDTDLGAFIKEYIRKIAHFTEYGMLGIEIAIYVCLYTEKKYKWAGGSVLLALCIGFIDESLQYISERGPEVSDIWVDVGGFATFSLLAYGTAYAIYLVSGFIKKIRLEKNNG